MRDPVQYARFSDERSRPFFNLLERVPAHLPFKTIVDLGCGAGELTRAIAEKYPAAHVLGTDYSPQMLAKSGDYAGAITRFREALALADDNPQAHYQLALALRKTGATEEARRHFEAANKLAPYLRPPADQHR